MPALEQVSHESQSGWPIGGINFRSEQSTLSLDIGRPNLAEDLLDEAKLTELTEHGFRPVDNPHITVINYGSGSNILRQISQFSQTGQGIILRDIERIATRQDWSWQPRGEFHGFVGRNQGTLKLIAMIDCPGVAQFYRQVEELIPGVEIEHHPMHITLLKKAISKNGLPSGSLAGSEFSRPLNGLGHLALGYNFNTRPDLHTQTNGPPVIPEFVRMQLLRLFRIDPTDQEGLPSQVVQLFNNLGQPSLPLPPDIKQKVVEDFNSIDIVAAAAFGRRLSLVPESLKHFMPGAVKPKPTKLSPSERVAYFDGEMEKALEALKSSQITPQRVVTGAIVRTARFFNNKRLVEEANNRLLEDPTYYPVRMRSVAELRKLSDAMSGKIEPKEDEKLTDTLQTEVNQIELAA